MKTSRLHLPGAETSNTIPWTHSALRCYEALTMDLKPAEHWDMIRYTETLTIAEGRAVVSYKDVWRMVPEAHGFTLAMHI